MKKILTNSKRRFILPVIIILMIVLLYSSCSEPGQDQDSDEEETVDINFSVDVPANTPNSTVDLVIKFFTDQELKRVTMTKEGETKWTASTPLTPGALIRYHYDRGDFSKIERFNEDTQIAFRYLLVSSSNTDVEDTVAMWEDIPNTPQIGTITGTVTGEGVPLIDATVSVSGFHAATKHDGSFVIEDVPVGKQRVTVTTTLGDYKPASEEITLTADGKSVDFDLDSAEKVTVTFNVTPPSGTPSGSVVKLIGNIYQLGSVYWHSNNLVTQPLRYVHLSNNRATLDLYEGTYVEYLYTLGNTVYSNEKDSNGNNVIRSFILGSSDLTRSDTIGTWKPSGYIGTTFNLTTPPNTTPSEPILISVKATANFGAAELPMDRIRNNTWTFTYYTNSRGTLCYRYFHGLDVGGAERFEPDSLSTYRQIEIDIDKTQYDSVERWRWFPEGSYPPSYSFTPVSVIPRTPFIKSIFFNDWWDPDFLTLFESTIDHFDDIYNEWINIAYVWNWKKITPKPMLENRATMALEDLRRFVSLAKSKGKKIWLNIITSDYSNTYWGPHDSEWFAEWYEAMREFYLYHAKISQELGIDAIDLHRVNIFSFTSPEIKDELDNYMKNIIAEMRTEYRGYISAVGAVGDYTFYRDLDFIGLLIWTDLGVSSEASVREIKNAIDVFLEFDAKPNYYDPYNIPVVIAQFHCPSIDDGANRSVYESYIPTHEEDNRSKILDLIEQARVFEAVFQSIATRTWIKGFMPFGYPYIDYPESKDEKIRGKPAETVLSEYYKIY